MAELTGLIRKLSLVIGRCALTAQTMKGNNDRRTVGTIASTTTTITIIVVITTTIHLTTSITITMTATTSVQLTTFIKQLLRAQGML